MSETKNNTSKSDAVPVAEVRAAKRRISIVWLVPLVALAIGGWLVYKAVSEKGPVITIKFNSAEGLEAGKTKIKYKDVQLGLVSTIALSDDLSHVNVTAELDKQAAKFISENTRFWVVRARVAATGVSGLGTLFSGAYIALDPGEPGHPERRFTGLEEPPVVTTDLPGRSFVLKSKRRGSLEVGSPVYYRHLQAGQVIAYQLAEDGQTVVINVFINEPYHQYVYADTRFWNASGLDIQMGADGIRVDTESVVSLMIGGIAFGLPDEVEPGPAATEGTVFILYEDLDKAMAPVFKDKRPWLLYFNESVKGLSPGAPVELRGMQIGQVLDIRLEYNREKMEFKIPVLIDINMDRVVPEEELEDEAARRKSTNYLVGKGMRAQLTTGSLVTGQKLITLDMFPDAEPAQIIWDEGPYPIFPTVPTQIEEISTKVVRIINKIDQLPIKEIGEDLKDTVENVKQLTGSPEIIGAAKNLNASLKETRLLITDLRKKVTPEIDKTLKQAQQALASAEDLMNTDSPLQIRMNSALVEISDAARSLRLLMDYLERHPESLLRGKGQEK